MSDIEKLTARRNELQAELFAMADALPKNVHGFREGPITPEMHEKKAELGKCKAALKRARLAAPIATPPVGRTVTDIAGEMDGVRAKQDAARERLRELEAERNLAIAIEKVKAMPVAERQAIAIVTQSIDSAEKFGKLGGK